jgi:hypothetical protein
VPDGATVMIDTGSTTAYVAAALAERRELTVITNSIEIARPLVGRGGHRVYIAGGEIRPDLSAVVGPEALAFLGQFRADLAILSIGAIDPEHGFMDYHLDEARVAQAMLARADRRPRGRRPGEVRRPSRGDSLFPRRQSTASSPTPPRRANSPTCWRPPADKCFVAG